MRLVTLLFLLKDDQVLLAMKKRGTGQGKWNGVGGKVNPNESIEEATIRECEEEIGVVPKRLEKVAELDFRIPTQNFHNYCHVYTAWEWEGEIVETEEMRPQWFPIGTLPFESMWSDDSLWLPRILAGEKIKAKFVFDENEQVIEQKITAFE